MLKPALFAAAALLCLATNAPAQQAAQPSPDDRARQWLTLMDNGNYAQAWNDAAPVFHKGTSDGWSVDAAHTRAPLGAMVSRDLHDVKVTGRTATVRYDSSFAQKARATETVILELRPPGGWSVSSYKLD